MEALTFPRIRVKGGPFQRGQQYGEQAAPRVERSIEVYRRIFKHYTGWDWEKVVEHARSYREPIVAYREHFIDELRGIAVGAGVPFDDVLALNVRTEVMFAAVARNAAREGCTSFVALPESTQDGHILVGQNWDWGKGTSETVVVLEVEPDQGPNFVTVVEAGLLAKMGMNAAGIGLVTNALISDQDRGEPAVPYHAVLRAILESETPSRALAAITVHRRASSANYLIAHRAGEAINAEAAPGDYSRVFLAYPVDGTYVHANHFRCLDPDLKDVGLWDGTDSPFRMQRLERLFEHRPDALSPSMIQEFLADHFNSPYALCTHPDPSLPWAEQYATVASLIMDLNANRMWLAAGKPCQVPYHELDYSEFLAD